MTRVAALLATCAALVPTPAWASVRYGLSTTGSGIPANSINDEVGRALAAEGWARAETDGDVALTVQLRPELQRVCAMLAVRWWDGQSSSPDPYCARRPATFTGTLTLPPTSADVRTAIVGPMKDVLVEEGRRRWTLRLSRGDENNAQTFSVRVGEIDATKHVLWNGAEGELNLPAAGKVELRSGKCTRPVARGVAHLDLADVWQSRSFVFAWLQDGREISEIAIRQDHPFQLTLAATPSTGPAAIEVPCSGEPVLSLDQSGYTASETSQSAWDRWTWTVTTKRDDGFVTARLRSAQASDDASIARQIRFSLPFWHKAWVWGVAAAGALGGLAVSFSKLIDFVRKVRNKDPKPPDRGGKSKVDASAEH